MSVCRGLFAYLYAKKTTFFEQKELERTLFRNERELELVKGTDNRPVMHDQQMTVGTLGMLNEFIADTASQFH